VLVLVLEALPKEAAFRLPSLGVSPIIEPADLSAAVPLMQDEGGWRRCRRCWSGQGRIGDVGVSVTPSHPSPFPLDLSAVALAEVDAARCRSI
jgi:hypothetical protein